jgi:hypothetical protein
MSSSLALQGAILQRLSTAPALLALLGGSRIYDDVPQSAPFPYVSFGATVEVPLDGVESRIDQHTITLQAFSRHRGRKEAATIIDELDKLLHDVTFPLAGHRLVNLLATFKDVRASADNELRIGIIRFRAVTEPLT